MRDLKFERLSDDGTHFVLTDSRGVEYTLEVDDALATAARRGLQRRSSRPTHGSLSPRDVQAMIRSGLSIEDVVETTGLATDFVRRFAEPVLAEMEFVVQRARRLTLSGPRALMTLDEATEAACELRGIDPEEVDWLCAREEDGAWRIRAEFAGEALMDVRFRVTEGTVTPTGNSPAAPVEPDLPPHWDAQHPAARAAARQNREAQEEPAPVAPEEPVLFDDPSMIF